jgi:hypothetical protein
MLATFRLGRVVPFLLSVGFDFPTFDGHDGICIIDFKPPHEGLPGGIKTNVSCMKCRV